VPLNEDEWKMKVHSQPPLNIEVRYQLHAFGLFTPVSITDCTVDLLAIQHAMTK